MQRKHLPNPPEGTMLMTASRPRPTVRVLNWTLVGLLKALWRLPHSVACWLEQGLDGLEAERLDRVRNPAKYVGKS